MNHQEIKRMQDELLDLRRKVAKISDFGQEKDRMLSTIALLVAKLGGCVTIDSGDDATFLRDWQAGKIIIRVEQSLDTHGLITFMVHRVKEAQDAHGQDGSREAVPGDAELPVESGAGDVQGAISNG